MMMLGRNRRGSNRPAGYSKRSLSSVAVVTRCSGAESKNVPGGISQVTTSSLATT